MKKIIALMAMVMAVTTLYSAEAQALPSAVIATIDTQKIRRDSAAGKDITRQLDAIRQEFQAQVTKKEESLRQEEQDLQTKRPVMEPNAFKAQEQAWRQKVMAVQREIQEKNSRLEVALRKASAELQRALKPIYQKILAKHKATLIMDKSLVIEQAPGLDVTTEVIEQLDQVLPTVKVEVIE